MGDDLASALTRLAAEREELGLEIVPHHATRSLAETVANPDGALDAWLEMTVSIAKGVDAKTAAAYLISIFVWRFDEILAALHLRGAPLPPLRADRLGAAMFVGEAAGSRDIQFRFHLPADETGMPFDRAALRRSIADVHRPLVEALHDRTGLSRHALWRLVTDGVSGGFLAYGKQAGCVDLAMRSAHELLGEHPLHNRQWSFAEIRVPGRPAEWFRLRGGCCRLYMTEEGDYCTSCVLRRREDQVERLQHLMRNRA